MPADTETPTIPRSAPSVRASKHQIGIVFSKADYDLLMALAEKRRIGAASLVRSMLSDQLDRLRAEG